MSDIAQQSPNLLALRSIDSLTDEELNWVAFCFVNNELSQTASDQFENGLANDLRGCEAVTRAVQSSIALAEMHVATSHVQRPVELLVQKPRTMATAGVELTTVRSAWTTLAAATAVCAVFFIGLTSLQPQAMDSPNASLLVSDNETEFDADDVARDWADALPEDDSFDIFTDATALAALDDAVLLSPLMSQETEIVPDWMVAAVAPDDESNEQRTPAVEN